jgi:hypothetical protein
MAGAAGLRFPAGASALAAQRAEGLGLRGEGLAQRHQLGAVRLALTGA